MVSWLPHIIDVRSSQLMYVLYKLMSSLVFFTKCCPSQVERSSTTDAGTSEHDFTISALHNWSDFHFDKLPSQLVYLIPHNSCTWSFTTCVIQTPHNWCTWSFTTGVLDPSQLVYLIFHNLCTWFLVQLLIPGAANPSQSVLSFLFTICVLDPSQLDNVYLILHTPCTWSFTLRLVIPYNLITLIQESPNIWIYSHTYSWVEIFQQEQIAPCSHVPVYDRIIKWTISPNTRISWYPDVHCWQSWSLCN